MSWRTIPTIVIGLALLPCAGLHAAVLVSEAFEYPASEALTDQNGGTGFGAAWFEGGNSSSADEDTLQAGSLQYDFLAASGNSLHSVAPDSFSTDLSRTLAAPLTGTKGRTLWVSFLMRKDSEGTSARNNYFGLVLYPSNSNAPALFVGDTGETDFYSLGVAGSGSGEVASASKSVVSATATLLLVKITFATGPDRIDLFVNPDLSQGEPTVPSATKSDMDLAAISAVGILAGLDATWSADEIRIGDSFGDVAPKPGKLANISTRLQVGTGANALIGGFIITGDTSKKVIVRALGPSLSSTVANTLNDPTLELRDSSGGLVAQNDNWRSTQEQEITATGIPPSDNRESAIVQSLAPGSYTAVLRGVNNTTGVGLVEVYDLEAQPKTFIANISTRGFVQSGDKVMIGGIIITGDAPKRVILRAIGPSLTKQGVPGALQDPTLELRNGSGTLVAQNDNWRSTQEQEIIDTTVPPSNDLESAIVRNLAPGNYTAIVRGVGGAPGVGLIEAYGLQ